MPMNDHLPPKAAGALARLLADVENHSRHGIDFRLLRRLPPFQPNIPDALPEGARFVALVDTETTGLSLIDDCLIEIAILMLCVDGDGSIVGQWVPQSWLEDPGRPLDPKIARLTGLTDADLCGHRFDELAIAGLLNRASLIVAHNAAFDAPRLELRFPNLAGIAWACSCTEIGWQELGYEGRALPFLLTQSGFFAAAHRAASDVISLNALLQSSAGTGKPTHLQRLLAAAARTTVRMEATHAPYALKDRLRERGYRWDADAKVWWTHIELEQCEAEQRWLALQNVTRPTTHLQTAIERHRPPRRDILRVRPWDADDSFADADPF